MTSAAFCTSSSERSGPPTTLSTTPLAPRMRLPDAISRSVGEPSMSGQDTAAMAASTARSAPVAAPMPTRHEPARFSTACTSAKSTLMRPGRTTISDVPTMACRSTLSQTRKASSTAVFSGTSSSRRSLLTSTTASACSRSAARLASKLRARAGPSKRKGRVTTATVSAPSAAASSATMGQAPLPVPPPRPAVTNTISAPVSMLRISLRLSCAAKRPTEGCPPAPSPRVSPTPSCSV
mmetsp:Transcript_37064/g.116012  ORF Transcript_37064/g.116012 Transcript_37064/m.116012 type:complete len:237 (+) Transcript_37064:1-711(+)